MRLKIVHADTLPGSKAAAQRPFDRGPPMRPKNGSALTAKVVNPKLSASTSATGFVSKAYVSRTPSMRPMHLNLPPLKRVSRRIIHFALRCWQSNSAVSGRIVRSDIIPFDSRPRIARASRETRLKTEAKKKGNYIASRCSRACLKRGECSGEHLS